MRQNVRKKGKSKRSKFNPGYLRVAAEAYLFEDLTYREINERYGISRWIMSAWIKKYSDEILQTNVISMQKETNSGIFSTPEGDETTRRLSEALEQAKMKIAALETLIHVAEEELGVNIRKKCGTRQ